MLKQWNMVLIILTYCLVIYGTFLTRSGVLSSVHAFAQSAIGPLFFAFITLTFVASLALLLQRWNELKSEAQMISLLSREALFLMNNLFFLGITVICFWGVNFPLLSELVVGQKVTVGPPFYVRATAPLFAGLFILMGIAPLSGWGHSTLKTLGRSIWKPLGVSLVALVIILGGGIHNPGALLGFWLVVFVIAVTLFEYTRAVWARHLLWHESIPIALWHLAGRNRRRYGGYLIHLAITLMALGVIGIEFFQTETQGTIALGDQLALDGYTIRYDSLKIFNTTDGRNVARSVVSVYKGGKYLGELYPRREYYVESQQPLTIAGVRSTMEDDLYVLLVDWQPISTAGATFKIYHNPLVNWLWFGSFILILGALVAAWPEKDPIPTATKVNSRRYAAGEA